MTKRQLFILCMLLSCCLLYIYFSQSILPYLYVILQNIQTWSLYKALFFFGLLYIVSNVFLLPLGLPLNLLAGFLWGGLAGGIIINTLATIVASISFFVARYCGNFFTTYYYNKYKSLRNINAFFNRYDWQFIFMARINPLAPFGLLNYIFGLAHGLTYKRYISATIAANALPCFAFSSLGALFNTFEPKNHHIHYFIIQVGLVFTLFSTVFILKMIVASKTHSISDVREAT